MKLAVQYSEAARSLVERGEVEVDLFKCPPWPEVVEAASALRPAMVHFDFQAGQEPHVREQLVEAEKWLESTETPFVNTHLAPPAGSRLGDTALFGGVRRDVEVLAEYFGADRVQVENVPWERRPDFPLDRRGASPTWMKRLVSAAGCRFLLDVAHARLASMEMNLPVKAWIESHPLDRLSELHVTGIAPDSTGRIRDSMPMGLEDRALTEWVLDGIAAGKWPRPWAVVLEYGGVGPKFEWRSDPESLLSDLHFLQEALAQRGLRTEGSPSADDTSTEDAAV